MGQLLLVFLAGFLASGVDGALGMGFGPTSSALLLGTGLPPATVSATVNIAKIGAGLAAGVAHWRFDNINRRLALTLALPGLIGALIGVLVLTNVDGDALRPFLAVLLLLVGLRILWRFGRASAAGLRADQGEAEHRHGKRVDWSTAAVGATGGCTNGLIGAWGPVVTPYLLHRGVAPHIAVGSVNTAEIAVAVVSAGALISSGVGALQIGSTVAMLAGGVLAAPIAAWAVRRIPPRAAGLSLAALLLFTQTRELASAVDLGPSRWIGYAAVAAIVTVIARPTLPRRPAAPEREPVIALPADLPA